MKSFLSGVIIGCAVLAGSVAMRRHYQPKPEYHYFVRYRSFGTNLNMIITAIYRNTDPITNFQFFSECALAEMQRRTGDATNIDVEALTLLTK